MSEEQLHNKILVVDDLPKNIQVIGSILEIYDYDIYFASDGYSALEQVKRTEFDLLLLDIMMPEIDGFEVCRQIKTNPETQDLPIIFLTAKTDSENITKAFELGAQDYITKPFNPKELISRVKTHLKLRRQNKKLLSVNELLEQKVRERTTDLEKANRKLARLDKAKNDFLLLINHELRTPLNGITGFTQMLDDAVESTELKEFVQLIDISAQRLLKLSETATLITSLKADGYKKQIETIDFKHLIEKATQYNQKAIEEKLMTFRIQKTTDDYAFKGDAELIEYALKIIINNAIRFSEPNKHIKITIEKQAEWLKINIVDEGCGFSNTALEQLFSFFAVTDIAHNTEKGLGLGLATVKLIMNQHNGTISVSNRPEGGATVSLQFPLDKNSQ